MLGVNRNALRFPSVFRCFRTEYRPRRCCCRAPGRATVHRGRPRAAAPRDPTAAPRPGTRRSRPRGCGRSPAALVVRRRGVLVRDQLAELRERPPVDGVGVQLVAFAHVAVATLPDFDHQEPGDVDAILLFELVEHVGQLVERLDPDERRRLALQLLPAVLQPDQQCRLGPWGSLLGVAFDGTVLGDASFDDRRSESERPRPLWRLLVDWCARSATSVENRSHSEPGSARATLVRLHRRQWHATRCRLADEGRRCAL